MFLLFRKHKLYVQIYSCKTIITELFSFPTAEKRNKPNFSLFSYDEYDYIYFNADDHYEISRGCTPVTASSEQTRTSIVNSNKTLWQNCRLVNENPEGDESEAYIECFSTCIYRYCNWEGIDPIVYFEGGEDDEAIFAIIFGKLLVLVNLTFSSFFFYPNWKYGSKSQGKWGGGG